MPKNNVEELTNAFKTFSNKIESFEKSHSKLKNKIDTLNKKLELKNTQLKKEISEGENVKNFLNNILDHIASGVITINKQGKITLANKAALEITNFKKNELVNKNYLDVFGKEYKNKSPLFTLTTGKESYHRQKKIKTKDGNYKDVEFSTSILKDTKTNKTNGVVEVINDISKIKKLQERITHIETLAALGEMAASVAHEIRNPLGGIGGFIGLLDRQIDKNDPKKKLIKPIMEGVSRLNNIVSNLLTFTRPQKVNPSKVDLHKTIDDILDFFKVSIENKNKKVEFKREFYKNEPQIYIDVQLFQQTLINIIKNAYEAVDNNGQICIRTSVHLPEEMSDILEEEEKEELVRLFSYVEIEIEDDGPGMNQELISKLFNPFFTTKDDGNGLGLAISKKLIQLHKGDIYVDSKVGKGTKFIITLPLYEDYGK